MSGILQDTKYGWGWGQWFIFFTSSPMDMARIRGLILKTRGIQLRGQKDFKKLNKLHENCEITCHRRLPELLIECFRLIIYLITFQPHLPPTSPLLQHLFLLLLPLPSHFISSLPHNPLLAPLLPCSSRDRERIRWLRFLPDIPVCDSKIKGILVITKNVYLQLSKELEFSTGFQGDLISDLQIFSRISASEKIKQIAQKSLQELGINWKWFLQIS